jgi:hypothetical protein
MGRATHQRHSHRLGLAAFALLSATAVGLLLGMAFGLWSAILWDLGVVAFILIRARQKAISREARQRSRAQTDAPVMRRSAL